VDEKERQEAAELASEIADDDGMPSAGRVYDIDSDSAEPLVDASSAEAANDTPAPAESAPEKRPSFKFSRQDILDRFQEKNSVITRLGKEKQALEKSRAALEGEKAVLVSEKEALESQVREFKDKWLRSVADLENYRKRSAKEWELLKQQTKTEIILEVLNSLDDFERAFAVVENREEDEFVRGIRLIYGNLAQTLQKLGVVEIDAVHQPFDPNRHMAIGQTESPGAESGAVVQVVQKGYLLNGFVIRPARVFVAK